MKKSRKILSVLLALIMMISIVPLSSVTASAETSGTCGENVTWSYNTSTQTLTISGAGPMKGYNSYGSEPWNEYRDSIKKVVVSNGVTKIGNFAFYCCKNLVTATLPNSIIIIGDCAFSGCVSLSSFTIPNGVKYIGVRAFANCDSLTSIVIPDSVLQFGEGGANPTSNTFRDCDNLTSVTIGKGLEVIGPYAFSSCDKLTNVVISEGTTEISEYAFADCISLKTVYLPKSLTKIYGYAFDGCSKIVEVNYAGTEEQWRTVSVHQYINSKGNQYLINAKINYNYCVHSYVGTVITPATHLNEGLRKYTCTLCGDYYTRTISKISKHTYLKYVAPPTCTEQGYTTYTCECGDSYVDDYVDATGHSYTSEITTSATHLTEGLMTYTCVCGDTYTEVIEKIEEHIYDVVVTAPTCTEQGYTTYTCVCGDTYVSDYVDATGHDYKATVTRPTCTEKGYTTNVCSSCGDSYIDNYKGATGHSYDNGIVTTKPTCTKTGIKTFTCGNCGDTYTEDVKALGHTPATAVEEKYVAPTCTENGSKDVVVYCSVCEEEISREIVSLEAIGHNYTTVTTAPTCTEQGYTIYTCPCGDSYVDDYVNATGHTPATAVEEKYVAPTCTENGSKDMAVYCSVCDEEISRETVVINATGHADSDGDGYCDMDNELLDATKNCSCNCHKTGISKFFFNFILFFQRLFGSNKTCVCGVAHY